MVNKICIKCKIQKNIINYYKGNNQCKSCKILYQKKLEETKILKNCKLESRICNKCQIVKDISLFNKYGSKCKDCESIYYEENKEIISIRKKKYNSENKEKNKEKWSKYYEYNKEIVLEKSRKRYDSDYKKIYYTDNKESIRYKRNERYRIRIKEDFFYKLKISLRSMIKNSFISNGLKKNNRSEYIIGCTLEYFKKYIEDKFETWMTWENKGLYNGELNYGWDIDYIIPLSSAKTEEELIRLNHYTNLQPLCSYTNRYIKKNNIIDLNIKNIPDIIIEQMNNVFENGRTS